MRPKWEIHVPNWVPNWGLTLWQWLLFEWWIKILFAIRNYQFLCSTTQICAQHGVLNENFLQKVAAKFNLTVFRGSFSRLTFWVRRRTCLGPPHIGGGSPLSGEWEGQASCPPNPPLTWDFSHLSGGWEGQASVRRQIVIIVINFNKRS